MLTFCPVSWQGIDLACGDAESEDSGGEQDCLPELRFTLRVFGRCTAGKSVCLVVPFNPHFYVEIPPTWSNFHVRQYLRTFARLYPVYEECTPVEGKTVYGFTNNEPRRFLRLAFSSFKYCKWAQSAAKKSPPAKGYRTVYEGNVAPELQLLHARHIMPASWVCAEGAVEVEAYGRVSTCDRELRVDSCLQVGPSEATHEAPPALVLASWDLEVYSPDGSFPDADREECPIIQAGVTFQRFGEAKPFARHVLVLGECSPVEGVIIHSYPTEAQLLAAFQRLVADYSADVLIGYNIWCVQASSPLCARLSDVFWCAQGV
jgi:DNA polymerase elongation subunit (family B)